MDGITEGRWRASCAIGEYRHVLMEIYTRLSFSQVCCTGSSSHVKKLEVTEIKMCIWECGQHTKRPCEKR